MTSMTPVPSVLLDQLRTTLPHDSDAGFFLSDIIDAARAVLDAVQPTAEDEPARITNADMLIEYLTDDEREMLRPWAAQEIEAERSVAFSVKDGSGWSHAITRAARVVRALGGSDE